MDENSKTLLLLLSGMAIVLCLFLLISGNAYPDGFDILGIDPDSSYSYEVSVVPSETLYNVTMFIPVPSGFGNSPAGYAIMDGSGYGVPDDMDAEVYGEGESLFLKVTMPETEGLEFGINLDSGVVIDTVDPVEYSYLLRPLMDLHGGESADVYKTYIYTSYDASPEAVVTIDVRETGMNKWAAFSEKTNYFDEHVSLTLAGPQKKWQTAGVSLSKRNGDYSVLF